MNCHILVSLKTSPIHVLAATALARPIEGIANKRRVRSSSLVREPCVLLRARERTALHFRKATASASFISLRMRESSGPASAQAAPSFS